MYHQWPQADTQLCSGRGPSCQSTRRVSRSWANPVLQTTAPAPRLLFSYPGHSVLSETETISIQPHNRIHEQFAWCRAGNSPVPYSWIVHLPAAPGWHLSPAGTAQLEQAHIWTLQACIFQINSELASWAHRAAGSCDPVELHCVPDQAV